MASYEDYNAAVKAFWAGRDLQTQKQVETGKVDAGARGSVTGGLHLDAMHQLIAREFGPLADLGAKVRQAASSHFRATTGARRTGTSW